MESDTIAEEGGVRGDVVACALEGVVVDVGRDETPGRSEGAA